jgi:hypothetical protein
MANMKVLPGNAVEMARNRTGRATIEIVAWRLRSRCGGSERRKPVSPTVCSVATSTSKASVKATPRMGAAHR